MTLDARLERLEQALNAGPNQRIEEECQARMRFAIKLLVWSKCDDLPDEWRLAFDQARQALGALPRLPKHQCAPQPRLEAEKADAIRRLVAKMLQESWSCRGTVRLSKEDRELWVRFAPHVSFPCDEGQAQIADEVNGSRLR